LELRWSLRQRATASPKLRFRPLSRAMLRASASEPTAFTRLARRVIAKPFYGWF